MPELYFHCVKLVSRFSVEREKTHSKLLDKYLKALLGRVNFLVKTCLKASYWSEQEELTPPAVINLAGYLPNPPLPQAANLGSSKTVCGGSRWYEC